MRPFNSLTIASIEVNACVDSSACKLHYDRRPDLRDGLVREHRLN